MTSKKSEYADLQCIEGDFYSKYVAKVKEVKELFATFSVIIQLPPMVIGFPYTKVDIYPSLPSPFAEKASKNL